MKPELDFDAHVNTALAVVADFTEDERQEAWLASLPVGTKVAGTSQGGPVTLTIARQGVLLGAYRWTFASALYYFGPLQLASTTPAAEPVTAGGWDTGAA